MINNNITFWSRFAKIYDFCLKKDKKAYEIMIENIKYELKQNLSVLELATGTGLLAVNIANACRTIEATDFSKEMIDVANRKEKPTNLTFSVQDATNLTFESNSFDVVIISNALHIMPEPKKALENVKKVLKEDGILIAPTFTQERSLKSYLFIKPMELVGFKTFSKWTYEEYIDFLKEDGWNIIKAKCIKARLPIAYVVANKH